MVSNQGLGCDDNGEDYPRPPDDDRRDQTVDRLIVGDRFPLPPLPVAGCLVLHDLTLCAVGRARARAHQAEMASAT